jgi:HEAT repeat protein
MKNKQTIKPLIASLKGGDYFATNALDSIDSNWRNNEIAKKTVLYLIGELKSENDDVREAVIKTLGRIKDISAINPLKAALKDKNPQIRSEAEFSLYLIDPNWKYKK